MTIDSFISIAFYQNRVYYDYIFVLQNKMKSFKEYFIEKDIANNLKVILLALFAAILFRSFLYEPFYIPSGSMKSTLLEGDVVVVSKYKYGFSKHSLPYSIPLIKGRIFDGNKPKRGDIIVFRLPNNTNIHYIKRLIGLPGDTVQIIGGVLYINGNEIKREEDGVFFDEKTNKELLKYTETLDENIKYNILQEKIFINEINNTKEYKVPENHYFFLGDNRDNSADSRFEDIGPGFVPYDNVIGKAEIILFSKKQNSLKIRFNRIFNILK